MALQTVSVQRGEPRSRIGLKTQIARELGIRVNQLRKWPLEFEMEELNDAPKRTPVEGDELAAETQECLALRGELAFKKMAIYSRECGCSRSPQHFNNASAGVLNPNVFPGGVQLSGHVI